jgi:hypothetical protein
LSFRRLSEHLGKLLLNSFKIRNQNAFEDSKKLQRSYLEREEKKFGSFDMPFVIPDGRFPYQSLCYRKMMKCAWKD